MVKRPSPPVEELALLVHPNMAWLSSLQNAFSAKGIRCVVARDLPTALIALSQHVFTLVLVGSNISEEGDGWALGGVARLLFSSAYIGVINPETSVLTLQAAINNGLDQVYESNIKPENLVESFLADRKHPSQPASVIH